MGIFDFLKKKKQELESLEKEKVKFEDITSWISKKRESEKIKEKQVLSQIKEVIFELIQELNEKSEILAKVDISKRKEDPRLKEVVIDNLEKYKDSINQLIEKLEIVKEKQHSELNIFINEINKILEDFQKRSKSSYERATILIGKELGDIKETLSNFFRSLNRIISENESILIHLRILKTIEQNLNELDNVRKEKEIILTSLKSLKESQLELETKKGQVEKQIETRKKSNEYFNEKEKKHLALEKKKEIEKNILKLKNFVDFKYLEKIHHTNPKKMNVIKSYENDFNQILEKENKELFDLINEQDKGKDKTSDITSQIENINQELKEINTLLGTKDSLEIIEAEIKNLNSSINEIESEELRNIKRTETLEENINSIKKEIASEITKMNVELV